MSRFSGPQPGYKDPGTRTKGVMRRYKAQKKLEAEVRDAELAPDDPKRRAVRLAALPEPDVSTRKRRRRRNRDEVLVVSTSSTSDNVILDADDPNSGGHVDIAA